MVTDDSLIDILHKRSNILCAIYDDPLAKPKLTSTLDVSRSTIDRGVEELAKNGCIERRDSKYHITILGEFVCELYQRYYRDIESLNEASQLLNMLPTHTCISMNLIRDADIHISNDRTPEAILRRYLDFLEHADRVIGLAPVGISLYADIIYEYTTSSDLSVETIIESKALRDVLEFKKDQISELLSDDKLDILVVDDQLHYSLWLMESPDKTIAGATIYNDGAVKGIIENTSPEAVSWVRAEYNRYREMSEPISKEEMLDNYYDPVR